MVIIMIKSEIISIANEYADSYEKFPLDLDKLLYDLNIELIETSLNNDGYYVNYNQQYYIFINESLYPPQRKRFTIAHEIGHYLLHGEKTILKVSKSKNLIFNYDSELKSVEQEANFFASELLAPKKVVIENLPNRTLTFNDIEIISSLFDISITSSAIKCIENSKTENEILLYFDKFDSRLWWSSAYEGIHRIIRIPEDYSQLSDLLSDNKSLKIETFYISDTKLVILSGDFEILY